MNHISLLPLEILKLTFSYLTKKDLVNNVRFVCKQWHKTAHVETVVISPCTEKVYRELLDDFANNPVFAANIKQMTLKDTKKLSCEKTSTQNNSDLISILQCCPSLTGMTMNASCSKNLLSHLDQIQQHTATSKNVFKLEFVDLRLNLDCFKAKNHDLTCHPNLQIYLKQVIKKLGPELRRFSVDYSEFLNYPSQVDLPLNFVIEDISDEKEMQQLKCIEINCSTCAISKESLERLVSNGFGNLEVLKLNLVTIDHSSDAQQYEELWDKLKKYCEPLKTYNICIRNRNREKILFALDNCTDEYERYSYEEDEDESYVFDDYDIGHGWDSDPREIQFEDYDQFLDYYAERQYHY